MSEELTAEQRARKELDDRVRLFMSNDRGIWYSREEVVSLYAAALAEIDALRAENERLRAAVLDKDAAIRLLTATDDAGRAQVEALRALVAEKDEALGAISKQLAELAKVRK